jgi:hypothetical protein
MTPHQFAVRLEKMADATEELCQELAEESLELIRHGFNTESDPQGEPWAPRVPTSKRTNPLLKDTRTLMHDFVIFGVNSNGFGIINDTPYAGYIHHGTSKMVSRHVVPGAGEGLGEWGPKLQEVTRDWIAKKLR